MIKLSRFKLLPLQQLQVSQSLFYDYDAGHRKHCKYCETALAKVGLYCQFVLIVVCLHFHTICTVCIVCIFHIVCIDFTFCIACIVCIVHIVYIVRIICIVWIVGIVCIA